MMKTMNWGLFLKSVMVAVVALLVVLTLVNVFVGYEFSDSGYTQSVAYRMVLGQRLYTDFDYLRTPLSPYMWRMPVELGANEAVIRLLAALERLTGALALGFAVYSRVGRRDIAVFAGLSAYACLFGGQLLLPFPIHDGLMFAALMMLCFARGWLVAAVLCAFMAAACKQSFYMLPPLVTLAALLAPGKSWHKAAAAVTASVVGYAWLHSDLHAAMQALQTGVLKLDDAYRLGVLAYIPTGKYNYLGGVLVMALVYWLGRRVAMARTEAWLAALLVGLPASALFQNLYKVLRGGVMQHDYYPAPRFTGLALLVLLVAAVVVELRGREWRWRAIRWNVKFEVLFAGLACATAWGTALTWGLATHIPAYGFLIAALLVMAPETGKDVLPRAVLYMALLAAVVMFVAGRVGFPMEETSVLYGDYVYDRQTGVWMQPDHAARLKEILYLKRKYALCVVVLPDAAQADWLAGTKPFLTSNWPMDIEMPRWQSQTGKPAEACLYAVKQGGDVWGEGFFKSSFTQWVMEHGEKVDSFSFHDIYRVKAGVPE